MSQLIGFMQGRLCNQVDKRIQAFPWNDWQHEFASAASMNIHVMEWTLDQELLYKNPLMNLSGQLRIRSLCSEYNLIIPSLTGDCFMQAPFWKAHGKTRTSLQADFIAICRACAEVSIKLVVVPLVDNGSLELQEQEDIFISFMLAQADLFRLLGLRIIFESDFAPCKLARFIGRLPTDTFGINYDIGNSAALGYNPDEEFAAYSSRIVNVHVKDRVLGGSTVPLGTGNADFPKVFRLLHEASYAGYLILQTARSEYGNHAGALYNYIEQIEAWRNRN